MRNRRRLKPGKTVPMSSKKKVIGLPQDTEPYLLGTAEALRQTDKALLVEIYDGHLDKQIWIPLSVVSPDSEVTDDGDRGLLIVYKWWAKANGYEE